MVKKSEQIYPKPGRLGTPESCCETCQDQDFLSCTCKIVKPIILFPYSESIPYTALNTFRFARKIKWEWKRKETSNRDFLWKEEQWQSTLNSSGKRKSW